MPEVKDIVQLKERSEGVGLVFGALFMLIGIAIPIFMIAGSIIFTGGLIAGAILTRRDK